MAVLEHFLACIVIDGKPCSEYAVEEDEDQNDKSPEDYPAITKYVEVAAGAQFAIRVQALKFFDFGKGDSIEVQYLSDGEWIMGQLQLKANVRLKTIIEIAGKHVGDGRAVRPFKFGTVSFRDNKPIDTAAVLRNQYANLATISLQIWLVRTIGPVERKRSVGQGLPNIIPEVAVKGGAASVQAILGEAEQLESAKSTVMTRKRLGKKPLAEFSFKCRTEEDLQKLSIIPRPRSPTPLEDRPIESLNATEMRELLLRKKAAEELSRVKIKQEKKEANLREVAAIKRSRNEAEDEDETIEVITIRKKKRMEPADIIEID